MRYHGMNSQWLTAFGVMLSLVAFHFPVAYGRAQTAIGHDNLNQHHYQTLALRQVNGMVKDLKSMGMTSEAQILRQVAQMATQRGHYVRGQALSSKQVTTVKANRYTYVTEDQRPLSASIDASRLGNHTHKRSAVITIPEQNVSLTMTANRHGVRVAFSGPMAVAEQLKIPFTSFYTDGTVRRTFFVPRVRTH